MTFKDYMSLKEEAEEVGVKDSGALKQLLHTIQAVSVARESWQSYLERMNKWEKNMADEARKEISKAKEEKIRSLEKPTNADRIRAMTDEELAEMFHNCDFFINEEDDEPCVGIWLNDEENVLPDSYEDILFFLQSESEV